MVMTNNVVMSYFHNQKKLGPKQARWQDFLIEFDYRLEYKPSLANLLANALSRKATLAIVSEAQKALLSRIKKGLLHDTVVIDGIPQRGENKKVLG